MQPLSFNFIASYKVAYAWFAMLVFLLSSVVGVQKTIMEFTTVMFIAKKTQPLDNTLVIEIQEQKFAQLVGKDLTAMNVSDNLFKGTFMSVT